MRNIYVVLLLFFFSTNNYAQTKSLKDKHYKQDVSLLIKPKTPDELWGNLFVDVQLKKVLEDGKSFVDAVPKYSPGVILKRYNELQYKHDSLLDLKNFVYENFKLPDTNQVQLTIKSMNLKDHLERLWTTLTRKADTSEKYSSLLPLPYQYVVPGGRFREIYYWDSYFTMQGLAASNRYDLITDMLNNFKYLIETFGHIPNGNRSYYLSRSQPPYFALMVDLLEKKMGNRVYKKYYSSMQKEYAYWMDGENNLKPGDQHRHVVKLADGTILNRYWDDKKAPREESYYEDVQSGLAYQGKDNLAYTNLRAGAESGWDFSSRWLADTFHLSTVETTNIIPVDLNCLLYAYENILAKASKSQGLISLANNYTQKALKRKQAIVKYCWNENEHYFFDYHFKNNSTTNKWSLAGVLPLFVNIATDEQAAFVKEHIENKFLKDGGLITTIYNTHQQWDSPNGWAPLQFLSVNGLMNYKYDSLAKNIAERWMRLNEKIFANTGKMLEKYNVENLALSGGGGEYPTQDGFGWTNGVYLKFYEMFRK